VVSIIETTADDRVERTAAALEHCIAGIHDCSRLARYSRSGGPFSGTRSPQPPCIAIAIIRVHPDSAPREADAVAAAIDGDVEVIEEAHAEQAVEGRGGVEHDDGICCTTAPFTSIVFTLTSGALMIPLAVDRHYLRPVHVAEPERARGLRGQGRYSSRRCRARSASRARRRSRRGYMPLALACSGAIVSPGVRRRCRAVASM
jgi:hypothetical protein